MSFPDWKLMTDTKQTESRRGLTKEQVLKAVCSELKTMYSSIARIRRIVFVYGLSVTDFYHDMKRETAFTPEETLVAPRVRLDERRGTPSFYWERTVRHAYPLNKSKANSVRSKTRTFKAFVRRKGAKTKERMQVYLLSKHIPILKKTQSISMKEFSNEPEWARTAATLIEPQLTQLRRLVTTLNGVSRNLIRFDRMVQKHTKTE